MTDPSTGPGPVARRLAQADPTGLLLGAIVSAAALATSSLHNDVVWQVAVATVIVLVVYWMADLYVHALSVRFDGDTHGLLHRLRHAADHKSSVLKGGVPAIVVYLLVSLAGAESSTAAFAALGCAVVLLTVAGYLGARQAGSSERASFLEGLVGGMLGIVIVIAKALLH